MLSSPYNDWLDHRFLALTRLAQRSLALQPGNLLISPKLTSSVGSSISIALHAATQARRLLALTAKGLPSLSCECHPMDHDSSSSGHANTQARPQILAPRRSDLRWTWNSTQVTWACGNCNEAVQ